MIQTSNEVKPGTLGAWLQYLADLNPEHMELGLERVRAMVDRLNLRKWPNAVIIEVAGTNGKGSTAALIAGALNRSRISTGLYTSPHLHRFNERVSVDGKDVEDDELAAAFSAVWDSARQDEFVPLTYFEYTTLAALVCFKKHRVRVLVLEVGLGGRLDAVNVLDAEIAVITSIGLDHTHILGNTLREIASEKAGIIKNAALVVTGELPEEARQSVLAKARAEQARVVEAGSHFAAIPDGSCASFRFMSGDFSVSLPYPRVPFECAGIAVEVLYHLRGRGLEISEDAVKSALTEVSLPGRMQLVHRSPAVYLDVAHNPPAAEHLKNTLKEHKLKGRRLMVLGMLKDKDIESVVRILSSTAERFYVASLHTGRGESALRLEKAFFACGTAADRVQSFETVAEAFSCCLEDAGPDDEILVCGSFVTVTEAADKIAELKNNGDHSWL